MYEKYEMKSIRMKSIGMESILIKTIRMKSIRMKKLYQWKKVYEWKVYKWKVYELKIVKNEKQPSNVFLVKLNGKCTQPNKKILPLDSTCTWSNVNLGYSNVTIQL